jgi:hypothetical protein
MAKRGQKRARRPLTVAATVGKGLYKLKIKRLTPPAAKGVRLPFLVTGTVEVYNEYNDTTTQEPAGYVLQDGDIIDCGNSSLEEVVVCAVDGAGNCVADVATYDVSDAGNNNDFVEVDLAYFESYEEYYDEDDNLCYEASDCGSSIGIRG